MFLCLIEPSVWISEVNAPDSSDDHIFFTANVSPFGIITLYTTPELPVPITLAESLKETLRDTRFSRLARTSSLPLNLLWERSSAPSLLRPENSDGISPENRLQLRLREISSAGSWPSSLGISPKKPLSPRFTNWSLLQDNISDGILPENIDGGIPPTKRFLLKSTKFKPFKFPISDGIVPASLLPFNRNLYRLVQFPISGGIKPDKSLESSSSLLKLLKLQEVSNASRIPIDEGRFPEMPVSARPNKTKLVQFPISQGSSPLRFLFPPARKTSSFLSSPMLFGISPLS
ncbi:hypothetical protein QQP08_022085 [Theobroma cacao]|nr:hypothetical protein QQP08_022085 [Theobroma cacao]